jgi:hypothetical protein
MHCADNRWDLLDLAEEIEALFLNLTKIGPLFRTLDYLPGDIIG